MASEKVELASGTGSDGSLHEYATQHFGFTTRSFVDGVFNAFMYYICDVFDILQDILEKQCPECLPEGREKEPLRSLMPRIMNKVTRIFDKLELYLLRNVFVVPPHVVLPEDAVHTQHKYSADQEAELDRNIDELQRKIRAEANYTALLKQQLARVNASLTQACPIADELKTACDIVTGASEGSDEDRPGGNKRRKTTTRGSIGKKTDSGQSALLKMSGAARTVRALLLQPQEERPP